MAEHRTFLKAQAVRSPEYRRYVALLPCWLCSAVGRSQAAHADEVALPIGVQPVDGGLTVIGIDAQGRIAFGGPPDNPLCANR